tara:strand:+ start:518 stop:1576 length:1059 start_codon:yes stop_codon:yes gene_type:complete
VLRIAPYFGKKESEINMQNRRIFLVTGGLGFIGKHFVQRLLDDGHFVINVDHINYASDREINSVFSDYKNYHFIQEDIAKLSYLPECDIIVNFAAESHVDNSIASAAQFCHSNFLGVQHLLDLVRRKTSHERPIFVQMSTDEVYGDITEGLHNETDMLIPSNPYSATKASADLLIQSYARTHGIKYKIIRPTNNYGSHQYPEKLIPKSTLRMKRGIPAIMHGDGTYIRSWLHVEDTVEGVLTIIEKGTENSIYNMSGDLDLQNIEVIMKIATILGVKKEDAYTAVENRAGQDVRYSLDDSKLRNLGWKPIRDFDTELQKIVKSQNYERFLNAKNRSSVDKETGTQAPLKEVI